MTTPTKEDTIRMAREAGFMLAAEPSIDVSDWYECCTEEIKRFAELIRADEREACAKQLDFNAQATSNGGDEYAAALLWQEAEEIRARGQA